MLTIVTFNMIIFPHQTSDHLPYINMPFNSYASCRFKRGIGTVTSGRIWNYGPSLHESNDGRTTFNATIGQKHEKRRFCYRVELNNVELISLCAGYRIMTNYQSCTNSNKIFPQVRPRIYDI